MHAHTTTTRCAAWSAAAQRRLAQLFLLCMLTYTEPALAPSCTATSSTWCAGLPCCPASDSATLPPVCVNPHDFTTTWCAGLPCCPAPACAARRVCTNPQGITTTWCAGWPCCPAPVCAAHPAWPVRRPSSAPPAAARPPGTGPWGRGKRTRGAWWRPGEGSEGRL